MNNKILKIKNWKKTHEELLKFINSDNIRTGNEIRNWIAQCIVYFTEVGVPQNIVDYFLSKLDYHKEKGAKKLSYIAIPGAYDNEEDKYEYETGIGPFTFDENAGGYIVKEVVNRFIGSKQFDRTKTTPILVSFKVAENILDNYEDEERIIPKALLNEFNKEETQDIYVSLNGIQNSYEKRSSKNILTPIVTTTELICKLIPELKNKPQIKDKLNKIYSEETILKKYNLDKEIVWALNNSRIIRNYDIHNPKKDNHTTLYEAVGYCHLLVLFISSILSSGEIKL